MNPYFQPLSIIIMVLVGLGSACLAKKRDKNPYFWFFLGVFFGIFALLTLLFFIKKKEPMEIVEKPVMIAPKSLNNYWYYLDHQNNSIGPLSFSALKNLLKETKIDSSTLVWHEDLEDWKPFHDLEESKL